MDASSYVAIRVLSDAATVTGGVVIRPPKIETPAQWCEHYGVSVVDGVATLFKVVRDDYRSSHGMAYTPGSTPEAPDWDGGTQECGGGLHFSPAPVLAQIFDDLATRYVACPVALSDMAIYPSPEYPNKIKARRVCGPIVEVDIDGNPLNREESAA